jgi:glyoxylase-like metal-dependent hydrolase (beta-lactamase superfamily II)
MRLTDRVCLVGSGANGFDLTHPLDCHVYLLDGGSELALVDAGAGLDVDGLLERVRGDAYDPARVRRLLLTHGHGDHAGGGGELRERLGMAVHASREVAAALPAGDEAALSVDVARAAGVYPESYRLRACPVDAEVREGDRVRVGDLELRVLATAGHCDGHVSYLLERGGERLLFGGDAVFHGGRILLQAIHDCRLDAQVATLRRLRDLGITALLPGHGPFTLRDAQRHLERANQALDRLLPPEQLVSVW